MAIINCFMFRQLSQPFTMVASLTVAVLNPISFLHLGAHMNASPGRAYANAIDDGGPAIHDFKQNWMRKELEKFQVSGFFLTTFIIRK